MKSLHLIALSAVNSLTFHSVELISSPLTRRLEHPHENGALEEPLASSQHYLVTAAMQAPYDCMRVRKPRVSNL